MKRLLLFFLFALGRSFAFAQINPSIIFVNPHIHGPGSKPILFLDTYAGHAYGAAGGFTAGVAAHYQTSGHLFSLKYAGTLRSRGVIVIFPVIESSLDELGIMYGRRWIWEASSLSISAGISHNWFAEQFKSSPNNVGYVNSRSAGIPFEASLKFFKKNRTRYKAFLLIPVGPPTAFGRSIGFKVIGNFARNGYLGFGISLGWGFHKKYQQDLRGLSSVYH